VDNVASNGGGGIECKSSSPLIRNCVIKGNTTQLGGGVYCFSASSPTIENSAIMRNTGSVAGGAVSLSGSSSAEIFNSTIAENTAMGYGGGIDSYSSSPLIRNCTIAKNTVEYYGSGISCRESPGMTVVNTIIWTNTFGPYGSGHIHVSGGLPSVTYSDVQGGFSGAGNTSANPLLTRFGYRLKSGSPCIDAGTTVGALATDYEGEARVGPPDMGIDEFVDTDSDGLADIWEMEYWDSLDVEDNALNDFDSDGLSNEMEYDVDTNPTYNFDTDRDNLSDDAEKYYETDTNDWDTDGDLFPDGWEVGYNYDPNNASSPDPSGDTDGDGLSNFNEMRYGTDPTKTDSDGDGVSDGAEVIQGSDPSDADDGGNPANCMSLELTVGDHSGSHSERYGLLVGHVYHVAPTFGEVATTNYSFVRGKEYTFRVQWIDTKLSSPDYDYTARIGGLSGSGRGVGFEVADPQGILGEHGESTYDFVAGKSGMLYVYGVNVDIDGKDAVSGNDVAVLVLRLSVSHLRTF